MDVIVEWKRNSECLNIISLKPFKDQVLPDRRKAQSSRMIGKFPDSIPVIIERSPYETSLSSLQKRKFLFRRCMTMRLVSPIVRSQLKLASTRALFLMLKDGTVMVSNSKPLQEIYDEFQDPDGFLYLTYSSENVFGLRYHDPIQTREHKVIPDQTPIPHPQEDQFPLADLLHFESLFLKDFKFENKTWKKKEWCIFLGVFSAVLRTTFDSGITDVSIFKAVLC